MAKTPVVYPVSADLSALLGAAVVVDAAWAHDVYLSEIEKDDRMRARRLAAEVEMPWLLEGGM